VHETDEVVNTVIDKMRFVTEEEIKISFSVASELDVSEFNLR
jgi:hypothetical protein